MRLILLFENLLLSLNNTYKQHGARTEQTPTGKKKKSTKSVCASLFDFIHVIKLMLLSYSTESGSLIFIRLVEMSPIYPFDRMRITSAHFLRIISVQSDRQKM